MHAKHSFLLFAVVIILALGWVTPAEANHAAQTIPYVVQPNDTLASIAVRNCTTWQHLYALNRGVIGPNPNVLKSGTVIMVPNLCGGPTPGPTASPGPGGCNSGPTQHAMGPVSGTTYTVVLGDTLFSIARRFCTTTQQLAASNGIPNPWLIFAGQHLTVPVGSSPTPRRPPTPPPPTTPTPTPSLQRYLTITNPAPGTVLPPTFSVSGTGAGLFEGNVVVTAFANTGQQLAQQPTTLQGPNVGTGGPGTWSTTLTVNVAPGTPGTIQATSPQSNVAPFIVSVTFGTVPPPSYKTFAPGECQIQSRPNAPLFAYPNGPQTSQFGPASGIFPAISGARVSNQYWYQISTTPGAPSVWAPIGSITTTIGNCIW